MRLISFIIGSLYMAKISQHSPADRKKMLEMVNDGVPEQIIRRKFGGMTSPVFALQLKKAMVEAGYIKQANRGKKHKKGPTTYTITEKGRLTINDLYEKTGLGPGTKFTLKKPWGKSNAWRLVPVK